MTTCVFAIKTTGKKYSLNMTIKFPLTGQPKRKNKRDTRLSPILVENLNPK